MKTKQKDWIKSQLLTNGSITRNECLRQYISRLAMHIAVLKQEGWEFKTERVEVSTSWGTGSDYKYILVSSPSLEVA